MQRLILLVILFLSLTGSLFAQELPVLGNRNQFLHDYTKTLSVQDQERLELQLKGFRKDTGGSLYVVLVDTTGADDIVDFTEKLSDKWEIKADILFLVAMKDKRLRIHVGRFLEFVPDVLAKHIIDVYMMPAFKRGEYADGTSAGLQQIRKAISGISVEAKYSDVKQQGTSLFNSLNFGMILVGILTLMQLTFWLWAIIDVLKNDFTDGSAKLTWLLVIVFLPVLGVFFYFFIGRKQKTSMAKQNHISMESIAKSKSVGEI